MRYETAADGTFTTYYVNDLTRSQTQDGITNTYELDAARRQRELDHVQKRVHQRWRALGLEPVGLQECRHTAATWLDHAGVSPKVNSEIMGHRTPQYQPGAARITLQRYTHVLPGELERAREQLEEFLIARGGAVSH